MTKNKSRRIVIAARPEGLPKPSDFRLEEAELPPLSDGKVLLVSDVLRTGQKFSELKTLVESQGGEVGGMAVVIHQPYPNAMRFDPLPFYYLAKLDAKYFPDAGSCDLCRMGVPVEKMLA